MRQLICVSLSVCWHYHTAYEISQALAHPEQDLVALVIQPFAVDTAIRSSKVLHLTPLSPKPFDIRTLPFRFRVVDWNDVDTTSHSFIGITYSWNIVICGNDARAPTGIEESPREIDRNAGVIARKTLFQDIFGKSAFAEISGEAAAGSFVSTPIEHTARDKKNVLSVFDAPAYLAPPIETLYSSLIGSFLTKTPEREAPRLEEELDESDEMIVDEEPIQTIQQGRSVEDAEIDSLIELFQKQSVRSKGLINLLMLLLFIVLHLKKRHKRAA